MKTVFIDCSPKRKLSASGFVASMTSVFVPGTKKKMKLRTKADHEAILTELEDADAVEELLEGRKPKDCAILAEEDGVAEIEIEESGAGN